MPEEPLTHCNDNMPEEPLPHCGDDLPEENSRLVFRKFVLCHDVVEQFSAGTILQHHEYGRRIFDHLKQFGYVLMAEKSKA